jgi:hypothetical protein
MSNSTSTIDLAVTFATLPWKGWLSLGLVFSGFGLMLFDVVG